MPTIAETLQLAMQHHRAGQLAQAEQLYRQILQIDLANADALHLLGVLAWQAGQNQIALDLLRQAVAQLPQSADVQSNLGIVYQALRRWDEAIACGREAVRLRPTFAEAHNNLGNALKEAGRLDEAVASCREALRLRPEMADAHNNLGNALKSQGHLDDAIASFRRAQALRPDFPEVHNNLGGALAALGKAEEANDNFRQAIRLRPNYPEAHDNYGQALKEQGQLDEAIASFREAIRWRPSFAESHLNLGLTLLLLGRFQEGSPEYEWRFRCFGGPSFAHPHWDGAPLAGRTILLWAEQGLGDTIQFIRYAPLVQGRGGRVVVQCQRTLLPLLAGCAGVDQWVATGVPLPAFDVQAPLLSLPGILGTTVETIPATSSYLKARPERVETWRREFADSNAFNIGIAWQGNPGYKFDRLRSVPLSQFAPLAALPSVRLLSLQKGAGIEQIVAVADKFPVSDWSQRLDLDGAFLDTAALMTALDLVITSDSAVAHLAGALGVPTWVALPFDPDWRWLTGREVSPWYPSLRLFRQPKPGDWESVFAQMADALKNRKGSDRLDGFAAAP